MARKRMIDPGIWTNEEFGGLSTLAQLLFIGMFSNADDEGRLKASPKFIKAIILPYGTEDYNTITVALQEIYDSGMVVVYSVNNVEYAMFPNWLKFQKIQKPTPSKLPPLPESYSSATVGLSTKGREGKGIEENTPPDPPAPEKPSSPMVLVKITNDILARTGQPSKGDLVRLVALATEVGGDRWTKIITDHKNDITKAKGSYWAYLIQVVENHKDDPIEDEHQERALPPPTREFLEEHYPERVKDYYPDTVEEEL